MGVQVGIEAIDADLEIGATNRNPGFLQEAQLTVDSRQLTVQRIGNCPKVLRRNC